MLAALILPFFGSDLDAILDSPKLAGSVISCTVTDIDGKVLFERNPSIRVMPGSNQKLLSNCFALHALGPNFQPQTRFWKLPGKVVIDSVGDPMMTHERLQKAAQELRLDGRSGVVVREAYRPLIPPSWELDDLPNKYAAPITAFTVDRGAIELWAEGEKLTVEPFRYWLRPKRGEKSGKRTITYDPIRRILVVDGELPKARTRLDTLALDQPDAAAASLFGNSFQPTDQIPKDPPSLILGGPPTSATIKECLVHSDNLIAENLLLMAAAKQGELGKSPYDLAPSRLKVFLIDVVGADAADFRPYDGSGMSRHNLVTTRGIARLLRWALRQPTKDIWLDALATPGVGTLADRLKGVPFIGKTGTLDSVVALSGYVRGEVVVSLILNHFACTERDARQVADEFIKKLAERSGNGTVYAAARVHEARPAFSRAVSPDADRHLGPRFHGMDARVRTDRRAQPFDALLH